MIPYAPSDVTLSDAAADAVTVTWQAPITGLGPEAIKSYRIFVDDVKTRAECTGRLGSAAAGFIENLSVSSADMLPKTTFRLQGLIVGVQYQISVSAVADIEGPRSAPVSFDPSERAGLPAPVDLMAIPYGSRCGSGNPDPWHCSLLRYSTCDASIPPELREVAKSCPELCESCGAPAPTSAAGVDNVLLRWRHGTKFPNCVENTFRFTFIPFAGEHDTSAECEEGQGCTVVTRTVITNVTVGGATTCNGLREPIGCEKLRKANPLACNGGTNIENVLGARLREVCPIACDEACLSTGWVWATARVENARVGSMYIVSAAAIDENKRIGEEANTLLTFPDSTKLDSSTSSSDSKKKTFRMAVLVCVAVVVLAIMVVLVVLYMTRQKQTTVEVINDDLEFQLDQLKMGVGELGGKVAGMFRHEFARTIGDNDQTESEFAQLEIDREQLTLGDTLGKGAFGIVRRGQLVGMTKGGIKLPEGEDFAVKTLLEGAATDELTKFLMEARLMSLLEHKNLLRMVAVLTIEQPFYIITELMCNGDLKDYLRACRPDLPGGPKDKLTPSDMNEMIFQIVGALRFLEFRHVIHRDLAARNVLASDNNLVKLADFGMSRNVYEADYYKKGSDDRVPVKWMAPESVNDRIYTNLSDVWSFGILIWEVSSSSDL